MKRMLKLAGWCLAGSSLWFAWAPLATSATDAFAERFAFELQSGAAFYSVTLPAAVYTSSHRSDLGDVRVFNNAGESVPYSLEAPREAARMRPVLRQAHWFPSAMGVSGATGASGASDRNSLPPGVRIAADGSLHAVAAPPSGGQRETDLVDVWRETRETREARETRETRAVHGETRGETHEAAKAIALLVHIRDDNYQGRVIAESSDDLRTWQPAGDAQLLKVTYNGSTLSQERIELEGPRARYVRLQWLDRSPYIESLDLEMLPISADNVLSAQTHRQWREGIVARAGPKAGEYFFETGGPFPVDRLRLNLPQPNTVAPAVIYSRVSLDGPWREVARATLFRLHNGDVEQTSSPLELKADTDRQWRVVFDGRAGGLGDGTLTVAAGWRPTILTFAAQGAAPFTLAVGNRAAIPVAVSPLDLFKGASAVPEIAQLNTTAPASQDSDSTAPSKISDAATRSLSWAAAVLAVGCVVAVAWRLGHGARGQALAQPEAMAASVSGVSGASVVSGVSGLTGLPGGDANEAGMADVNAPTNGKG